MTRGSVGRVPIGVPSFDAPADWAIGRWRASVADVGETVKGFYPRTVNVAVERGTSS